MELGRFLDDETRGLLARLPPALSWLKRDVITNRREAATNRELIARYEKHRSPRIRELVETLRRKQAESDAHFAQLRDKLMVQ